MVFSFIYYITYFFFRKPLYTKSYKFKEAQASFFAKLNEQLSYVKFIKINGLVKKFINRLNAPFYHVLKKALQYQMISYTFSGLDNLITVSIQVIIFLIGGYSVIQGNLSVGQMTIIFSYVSIVLNALKYFFHLGKSIQIGTETNGFSTITEINKIEAKQLNFSYNEDDVGVIQEFSYVFEKGNMYAITGDNGSGKSTLVNLLLGLNQDSFTGEILYNDISIKEIDMNKARNELIAISEQEPSLIADTLYYNLFFCGDTAITNSHLSELINIVGLQSYIDQLPNMLNTCISENASNISGGEKQKLSILRSLIKNSDLLILDEPTSALDKKSINKLLSYLKSFKKNKIILIITHNMIVEKACDYTINLDITNRAKAN